MSGITERSDPLSDFFTKLLRSDTLQKNFFIVVRSFTAVMNLLQPTVCVNSTPRAQRRFHVIACGIFMRSCCVFDSPRLSLPLLAVYLLSASSSTMWWTNTLRTSANEDLGTLAEYDPLTKPMAHRLGSCTRSPSSTAHMAVTTFSHSPGQGDWPYVFHIVRSMGSRIERADPRQSLGFFGLVSLHWTSALTTLNICSQPQSRRGRLSRCFFVGFAASLPCTFACPFGLVRRAVAWIPRCASFLGCDLAIFWVPIAISANGCNPSSCITPADI